jgi:hypothetical protein
MRDVGATLVVALSADEVRKPGRPQGSPLHRPVLGAKGMDREIILRIDERRGARPAGAEGVAAERLDRVFVAVLGMNGLAAAEIE